MSRHLLWAPWRLRYLTQMRRRSRGCLFCQKGRSSSDARNLVFLRGEHGFCLLNLFPYNNGHFMVAPYRHVGKLSALTAAEWLDLWALADEGIRRCDRALGPQGYNLGVNLGMAAGAGIPDHLHLHVVPRWGGDTNFMPVLTDAKVISQSLKSAYTLLKNCAVGRTSTRRRRGQPL